MNGYTITGIVCLIIAVALIVLGQNQENRKLKTSMEANINHLKAVDSVYDPKEWKPIGNGWLESNKDGFRVYMGEEFYLYKGY